MQSMTDTHVHLWELSRLTLSWLSPRSPLSRDFTIDEYQRQAKALGIERAVYVEVDVPEAQRSLEVDLVAELCRRPDSPIQGMVAAGDPAHPDFPRHVQGLSSAGHVRGVRRVLHTLATPPGHCLEPAFVKGVRTLGEHQLSFELCMRSTELGDAARLASICPETLFIVEHCGNADPLGVERWLEAGGPQAGPADVVAWAEGMRRLAALPNTVCKLSGIAASLPKTLPLTRLVPTLEFCIDLFGSERAMFGSDWPVCTLRAELAEWVEGARALLAHYSAEAQWALLDATAARVYRLR